MIEVRGFDSEHAEEATALFVNSFARLRTEAPGLPNDLENPLAVAYRLGKLGRQSLMAVENGRLLGYLAWKVVDRFRGSERRAAYVPEWAHAALPGRRAEIYRALYRAATEAWTSAGCDVHAITLLANEAESREAWFWNGFGLAVVDAVREAAPLREMRGTPLPIRAATVRDAEMLATLDAEHVEHYSRAPVFMAPPIAESAGEFAEFVQKPKNSIWVAFDGDVPAGFMRFTGYDFDAVAILMSDTAAFCNGAYVRPGYRGRHVGAALLQAALQHYAALGFTGVYTNFESFNPEAASFWPRYFRPVCYSLMRVPEVLEPAGDRA